MSGESVIERLNELPAHELRKMVTDDSLYYRAEVLDLARYVLEKRGVKPDANEYRIITPEGEERSSLSASAIEALYKERRINQDTLVFVEEHRLWLKLAHAFDLSEWGHKRQDSCPSAKPPVGQDQDLLKLARQFQADDLSYRREHRWNIFSWASSLLLGGIGGLFAISRLRVGTQQPSVRNLQIALVVAIFIFAGYTISWLRYHYERENWAKEKISSISKSLLVNLEGGLRLNEVPSKGLLSTMLSTMLTRLPATGIMYGLLSRTSFEDITVILLGLVAIWVVYLN